MKFLVDAQLPRRLATMLKEQGHDAVHATDFAEGNRTSDSRINEISKAEERVVITKDVDFVNSFLILKKPHRLLLVSTGNLSNVELNRIL